MSAATLAFLENKVQFPFVHVWLSRTEQINIVWELVITEIPFFFFFFKKKISESLVSEH